MTFLKGKKNKTGAGEKKKNNKSAHSKNHKQFNLPRKQVVVEQKKFGRMGQKNANTIIGKICIVTDFIQFYMTIIIYNKNFPLHISNSSFLKGRSARQKCEETMGQVKD